MLCFQRDHNQWRILEKQFDTRLLKNTLVVKISSQRFWCSVANKGTEEIKNRQSLWEAKVLNIKAH